MVYSSFTSGGAIACANVATGLQTSGRMHSSFNKRMGAGFSLPFRVWKSRSVAFHGSFVRPGRIVSTFILLNAVVFVAYAVLVNQSAVLGYELSREQRQLGQLKTENQRLETKQAFVRVQKETGHLAEFEPASYIEYLGGRTQVSLK